MPAPALLLTGLLLAPASRAAEPGEPVAEALAIQLTPQGLSRLGEAVQKAVPPSIPIAASAGTFACSDDDAVPLAWSLDALEVQLQVDEVAITTADGRLDLELYATLNSSASTLAATGDCSVLTDLDEACAVQLPTTAIQATFGLEIVQAGDGSLDVVADDPTVAISPVGNPLGDCTLASAVGTVLGQDPAFISDLLLSFVEPELAGLGLTVEESLEGPLNALALETTVDMLGVQADVALYPTLLELSDRGVLLGLGGEVVPAALSDCVDSSAGSLLTEQGWPDFAATAAATSLPHDAALWLGADFLDQALYSLWAAGLLCLDASALMQEAGLELTPGMLDSLLGGGFIDTFGEDAPLALVIDPATPPRAVFSDDRPALAIDPGELGLELYTELDERMVRVFQVDVLVQPGVDVYLDGGELRVDLVLEAEDIRLQEAYAELIDPGFSDGLSGLVETALSSQLPENPLFSLALPAPLGVGIGPLTFLPHHDAAWLGGFLLLDTSTVTPPEVSGCSLDGFGCDGGGTGAELDLEAMLGCSDAPLGCGADGGSGCEGGAACTSAGSSGLLQRAGRGRLVLLGGLAFGLMVRRRRDAA